MTSTTKTNRTASKVIFILALVVLSSVKSFGQNNPVAASSEGRTGAQMELVSWLMATKQSQMGSTTGANTSTNETGKKQFINNGMTTSRILNRTFLKKAMSRDNDVA